MISLTNSERNTYKECIRKWHYNYELKRSKLQTSEPLYMGSAIGIGLDAIWEGDKDYLKPFEDYLDKNGESHKKLRLYYMGRAMLMGYIAAWDLDEFGLIATERKVVAHICEGIENPGMVDKFVRHKDTGQLYQLDHKTTTANIEDPTSDYWSDLMIDNQPTGYKVALEQETGEDVGIMYDVIKKHSATKPKMKKKISKRKSETVDEYEIRKADVTESWEEFGERLLNDYLDNPGTYYRRQIIARTSSDVEEWRSEFQADAIALAATRAGGVFTKSPKTCTKWGSRCAYYNVCRGLDQIDSDNFITRENRHPELDGDDIKGVENVVI